MEASSKNSLRFCVQFSKIISRTITILLEKCRYEFVDFCIFQVEINVEVFKEENHNEKTTFGEKIAEKFCVQEILSAEILNEIKADYSKIVLCDKVKFTRKTYKKKLKNTRVNLFLLQIIRKAFTACFGH